jgi:hypothetical protein
MMTTNILYLFLKNPFPMLDGFKAGNFQKGKGKKSRCGGKNHS